MNYESMSFEELRVLKEQLGEKREEIRQAQIEIQKIMDKKVAEETAKAKVALMSDAERVALAQIINVPPIETSEAVKGID